MTITDDSIWYQQPSIREKTTIQSSVLGAQKESVLSWIVVIENIELRGL